MADKLDEYFDLGSYSRDVKTEIVAAQVWFNRGLIWCYAFNHEEAVECFERAMAADRDCAMAYWGLAFAIGPNYNKPWEAFDGDELSKNATRAHEAIEEGIQRCATGPAVEAALMRALRFRYAKPVPAENEWQAWNQDYAAALEVVYKDFPEDLDVAALYADALMNLTPWKLWDIQTGEPAAGAKTMEAKEILEIAMARDGGYAHPGLLHLYIHLMEMSGSPETALNAADRLRDLVPHAGHLAHMPTHIDILCGDYRRAMASNLDAVRADEIFLQRAGPMNFYTLYRAHNYHFRIYAAMFAGQSAIALSTAAKLEESLPLELLKVESPPMADWLEGFLSLRIHVLVRFGRWEDLIALQLPEDTNLCCVTTAMTHYGKGVAFAVTGHIKEAETQRIQLEQAIQRVPSSRTIFNNSCQDILAIAASMLMGELEYRRGNLDAAFHHLRESIRLDDNLPYDEPWGWMQPTRHAYGALLLEQNRVEEAEKVYAADLGFSDTLARALQHPNNVWSLAGYHECLLKLGRHAEARIIMPQLRMALAGSDVKIQSSCFCRKAVID
jgi:tetratricopeptide (TPR) repeat protein